jgi:hypothetical protein
MKIYIFGSTGFLGKVLLAKAVETGYQVRTVVRDPDRLGRFRDRVEFSTGTVFDPREITETVRGTDVVLSTVGPPQRGPVDPQKYERAMEHLIAELKSHGITRYVHTGGAVHDGGENEEWTPGRRALRMLLNLVFKQGMVAKHKGLSNDQIWNGLWSGPRGSPHPQPAELWWRMGRTWPASKSMWKICQNSCWSRSIHATG